MSSSSDASRRSPADLRLLVLPAALVIALLLLWRGAATGDPDLTVGAAVVALLLLCVGVLAHRVAVTSHQLAAARRTITALGQTSHELLWRTDADGRVCWANGVAADLLGYPPEELIGRSVTEFVDPAQAGAWARQIPRLARVRSGWRDVPHTLVRRDGRFVLVETSARPVLDHHGALVGYEGTVRPRTTVQAEVERLAEQRDRVAALLDTDTIRIAFQPIVSLSGGEVVGVEALTRFVAEPAMPPDQWFAQAWEVGLGVALELQSLQAALAAIPALPDHLYVSVNAAPRTVVDPAFLELLDGARVPLRRLVLEITEHESIDDYGELIATLREVRSRGLRLAVDDAGAGYASFRHIVKLRPDHIKLDRDLTLDIDNDPARRALASAVVVFALELDASVTAEGVETAVQLDTLRSLSVDAAQGYYLGRPVTDPLEWAVWRRPAVDERSVGIG